MDMETSTASMLPPVQRQRTESDATQSSLADTPNEKRRASQIEGSSELNDASPTESPGEPHESQPKQKRTRRQFPGRNLPKTSCMRCKSKKMRCEASEKIAGICKRCEKGRHQCEYQVPDSKPKSTKCMLDFQLHRLSMFFPLAGRFITLSTESLDSLTPLTFPYFPLDNHFIEAFIHFSLVVERDTGFRILTLPVTKRIETLEQTINHLKSSPPDKVPSRTDSISEAEPNQNDYRLDRLEQSLIEYTSQLGNQTTSSSTAMTAPTSVPVQQQLPSVSSALTYDNLSYSHSRDLNQRDFRDAIDQGLLDMTYAGMLLSEFRIMCHSFPYVIIPPEKNVQTLRYESPMLLLALLAAAAWRNRSLQLQLEKCYLRVLGLRMVVEGEQSIDMLQSLLVHLSWCHFHLKSSYRLTAYATSLVVNMGLNKRPYITPQARQQLGVRLPFPYGNRQPSQDPAIWSSDARRAYIGTYVICSSYSHALRKAGVLRYTPYLEECASTLLQERAVPSDEIFIHYVQLIHHAEDICDTFGYDSSRDGMAHIAEPQIQFYVRSFNATLETIKADVPQRFALDTMLSTYSHMVSAYTQEIGLHGLGPQPGVLSIPRTTILVDCLTSVKMVLDSVATLTEIQFYTLLGFNWARVHYVLNLGLELSVGIESPSWSVENVRSIVELESYIDIFVRRLDEHSGLVHKKDGEKDWFDFLSQQWKQLRKNYVEGMRRKGVTVNEPDQQWNLSWEGLGLLGDMDFMPNEWFWMADGTLQ